MLRNLVLGGLLIALVVAGAYVGCGPRGRVVKDKMIKEIDKVLGDLNVKRAAVQIGYEKALAAKDKMLESRIETQALRNRFEKDIKDLQAQQDGFKKDLNRLKPLLVEAQSAGADGVVGDNKVPVSKVKALAEKVVKDLNRSKEKLEHKQRMFGVMEKNLNSLVANENATKKQLAKFKNDLEEIDAKKDLLDSMKTDASLVSEGVSLNEQFDKLAKDVDELMLKVDTKVAVEEARLDERIADLETSADSSVDDILGDANDDVADLLSGIEDALKDN